MFFNRWIFLGLCLLSVNLRADMVVEGLQYPAWVETAGIRKSLALGVTIASGQQIITGTGGKVWLKMPDHARVKIGPQATLNVGAVDIASSAETEIEGTLQGALEIVQGAFRYTTTELSKFWRRDVSPRLGNTATIGIRGTDLWGQVDGVDQFVVLIEGRITVKPQASPESLTLQSPLQIYRAGTPDIDTVDLQAVQALAPITELDAGTGVMRQGGKYRLNLASFSTAEQARQFAQELDQSGLASSISKVEVQGRVWWRVSVLTLASLQDGRALRDALARQVQVTSAWISQS